MPRLAAHRGIRFRPLLGTAGHPVCWQCRLIAIGLSIAGGMLTVTGSQYGMSEPLLPLLFVLLGLWQLALAVLLLQFPGGWVKRVAGITALSIPLVSVGALRLMPTVGWAALDSLPNLVTAWLEVALVVALAVMLPVRSSLTQRTVSLGWAFTGVIGGPLAWLVATGMVQWAPMVSSAGTLRWVTVWSPITPALVGAPLPHVWLLVPWWAIASGVLIALLLGVSLGLAPLVQRGGVSGSVLRRVAWLHLLPAVLLGPACCVLPLAALVGIPVSVSDVLAPFASVLTVVLLSAQAVWTWCRARSSGWRTI